MTVKVDAKKRVVLPQAKPGEVYDLQEEGEGRYLLVRLERPEPRGRLSRGECLQALDRRPLSPAMCWEGLRRLSRDP